MATTKIKSKKVSQTNIHVIPNGFNFLYSSDANSENLQAHRVEELARIPSIEFGLFIGTVNLVTGEKIMIPVSKDGTFGIKALDDQSKLLKKNNEGIIELLEKTVTGIRSDKLKKGTFCIVFDGNDYCYYQGYSHGNDFYIILE